MWAGWKADSWVLTTTQRWEGKEWVTFVFVQCDIWCHGYILVYSEATQRRFSSHGVQYRPIWQCWMLLHWGSVYFKSPLVSIKFKFEVFALSSTVTVPPSNIKCSTSLTVATALTMQMRCLKQYGQQQSYAVL